MKYAKAVVAAVSSVASALTAALADNVLGTDEWGSIASTVVVAVLGVYAVWRVPNAE